MNTGVLAPYLLVSYRPESTSKDLQMFINTVFPLHRPPLTGEALLREIRLADIYVSASKLLACQIGCFYCFCFFTNAEYICVFFIRVLREY